MDKEQVNKIGIIIGVIIVIIGFFVQGIKIESSDYSVGEYGTKFGADFYTEIYDVTRDVGISVNKTRENVCHGLERVCDAIGWLIVVIGVLDILHFVAKKADDDNMIPSYQPSATIPKTSSNQASTPKENTSAYQPYQPSPHDKQITKNLEKPDFDSGNDMSAF